MKPQFLTLMETISGSLTSAGAFSEFEEFSPEEQQFFDVLFLCYDLLTRTNISKSVLVDDPDEGTVRKYGITSNSLADFAFAVTVGGSIDLKSLLRQVMFPFTQKSIAAGVGIRENTISDFLTGKKSMTVRNYQSILNYCIHKKN